MIRKLKGGQRLATKSTGVLKLGAVMGHKSTHWPPLKMFFFLVEVGVFLPIFFLTFSFYLIVDEILRWAGELVLHLKSGWGTSAEGSGGGNE